MKRIAVIGLGLMGGSLAMAVKAHRLAERVSAYARREQTRREAEERGIADEIHDSPEAAVKDAELIVFCTPILSIPDLARACLPGLDPNSVVTDVGSTKAWLAREMAPLFKKGGASFVGSHPMTGSEQTGLKAARVNLYHDAVVIVTPTRANGAPAIGKVTLFWERLGATVVTASPEEHDSLVARTSHLPHLVAAMLISNAVRDGDRRRIGQLCGPGFRDATRVAEGSPDMWHDVVKTNAALQQEIASLRVILNKVEAGLRSADFEAIQRWLEEAKKSREDLMR